MVHQLCETDTAYFQKMNRLYPLTETMSNNGASEVFYIVFVVVVVTLLRTT